MAKNKTTENKLSVSDFLNKVEDDTKRKDSFELVEIISKTTGFEAKMWGTAIVGFGSYHYVYESGREGDAPLVGFSPRKDAFALYLSSQLKDREALLEKFGKHKTAKACVYIKKLSDIDVEILKKLVTNSVERIKSLYP
ncbi:DUF1801 domain-containing protein [Pedobacter fastidiosus]|uniref:DUF1801 domain-containing protein n=1 Tax=Pedobacter fastidiosus TaxID=2765361 RepID=A0ABR7KU28_9SPHI|nr:DUF1801 domain-containing protein [Pedobacter fastidiosus]MBC6111627.1 DUF1801 domain-containing protein [Pedobacter fastidiosus]